MVEIPRIKVGERQTIETLINEETLRKKEYLDQETMRATMMIVGRNEPKEKKFPFADKESKDGNPLCPHCGTENPPAYRGYGLDNIEQFCVSSRVFFGCKNCKLQYTDWGVKLDYEVIGSRLL